MSSIDPHIEDSLRDAFSNWEPEYSHTEMNQAWQHVSRNIPQPQAQQASHSASQAGKGLVKSAASKAGIGAGKILGMSAIAAAIITITTIYFTHNSTVDNQARQSRGAQAPIVTSAAPSLKAQNNAADKNLNPAESVKTGSEGNRVYTNTNSSSGNAQKGAIQNSHVPLNQNNNPAATTLIGSQGNSNPRPAQGNSFNQPDFNTPLQPESAPDTFICISSPYSLRADKGRELDVQWGDGKRSIVDESGIQHFYSRVGSYTLNMGSGANAISRQVIIQNSPETHFTNYETNGLTCRFKNLTENTIRYSWEFGDNSQIDNQFNPEHTYQDTGRFKIRLTAYASDGCSSTDVQEIHVNNATRYSIPSIITPNGDGKNDVFDIIMEGQTSFELNIYDANMHLVFTSVTPEHTWDGNDMRTGNPCKVGDYFYIIKYQYPGKEASDKTGTVRLTR